jgi:hypothetical protein
MDPVTLAAAAVALLGPYIARTGAEFAGEAGKAAWALAGRLLTRLRDALNGDEAFDEFERQPDQAAPAAQVAIQRLLERDRELAAEVAALLEDVKRLGPHVLVTQRIRDAEDVVGLQARSVRGSASVDVQQDMVQGRRIVGAQFDELG